MKLTMSNPFVAVLVLALTGMTGCSDNPVSPATPAGETAESGRSEPAGEHGGNEGGEGREGSEGGAARIVASAGADEGGGEGSESHAGSESGGEGGDMAQKLAPNQRYDQTRNGARLIMSYSGYAFHGTVENTTNRTLRRVRVEVHLSDAANAITAELGPTTPTDLAPGGTLPINLPAVGRSFASWSPHAEVGSGEGGGGEGNETGGHAEGPEGGGEGDPSSPILALDESWDGVVNGVRVAMSYDPVGRSFSGLVENTTEQTLCSVQIELNLKQGTRTVVELGPAPVGDLAPGASATTELSVDDEPLATGVTFDAWEIHPEVFDCNGNGPDSGGEGNEISGHAEGPEGGGGGESGESHAGSESGGEGGDAGDTAEQLAPDQRYDQTRNGARLVMVYNSRRDAFHGIVENTTNRTLRRVRVEIHLSDEANAVTAELGPTTPTSLAPGRRLLINLPAAGQTFAGWSPHVEVGSGEGGGGEHGSGAGGGEGGEGHAGREGREGGESHAGREGREGG